MDPQHFEEVVRTVGRVSEPQTISVRVSPSPCARAEEQQEEGCVEGIFSGIERLRGEVVEIIL
jgi:hypothetical protein